MVSKVTKPEPSFHSETDSPPKVERWLRWDKRDGEELVGEIKLEGLTVSQLEQVFTHFHEDQLMYYCYPVETNKQVEFLAIWGKVELDLDSYEYFVECNAA
ncbi:MAG: hypothetical protein WBM44_26265 [Waterburya sp.]